MLYPNTDGPVNVAEETGIATTGTRVTLSPEGRGSRRKRPAKRDKERHMISLIVEVTYSVSRSRGRILCPWRLLFELLDRFLGSAINPVRWSRKIVSEASLQPDSVECRVKCVRL